MEFYYWNPTAAFYLTFIIFKNILKYVNAPAKVDKMPAGTVPLDYGD